MSCALLQTSAHAPSPSEPRVRGRVSSIQHPVGQLVKDIYGIRQGPRNFRIHSVSEMKALGYKPLVSAPAICLKLTSEGDIIIATP